VTLTADNVSTFTDRVFKFLVRVVKDLKMLLHLAQAIYGFQGYVQDEHSARRQI
jgi:hypothetical protein